MSMMGTLVKVGIGMALAKGVSSYMNKSGGGQAVDGEEASSGGGIGDILGQLTGGQGADGQSSGGIGDMLGQLTGGQGADGQSSGGIGDMLGQLTGGQGADGQSGGGIGDMLGQLTGGSQGADGQSGGGIGDMLGQLTGGAGGMAGGMAGGLGGILTGLAGAAAGAAATGGFGDMFNNALQNGGEPDTAPSEEDEATAGVMLRAMIQAAKSDGEIDDAEREKIGKFLESLSEEEREFVNEAIQAPVDVDALAADVPEGMEGQVYMMSVMSIDLDHMAEAKYLRDLAAAMNLEEPQINAMHEQMGVPSIYS